ncbi:NADH-quinone oxidoreductase subunit N [Mucilaginibacter sp.]
MHELLPYIPNYLSGIFNSLYYFMPEVYLSALFIIVFLTDLITGKNSQGLCKAVACIGMLVVVVKDLEQLSFVIINGEATTHFIFNEMCVLTRTAVNFKFIIDLLAFVLLLYTDWDHKLRAHKKGLSDMYSIIIASVFGLHLMTMAFNLLSIYLSIEMVSLASYLLVAYRSENAVSTEAGLKYVLFGAAASAIMLYGISLLYGFTGSLSLLDNSFIQGLSHANGMAVSFALVLVLLGIGFKLSFIPMHFWVPDVYEGASTPVTAYLSTLPKIAGFALLINFLTPFIFFAKWTAFDFKLFISIVGIATMIAGNFAAILQTNVKRMLAYSSIGHTGFVLMGIVTFNQQGITALTYYLLVYGIANIGAMILASYFANLSGAEDMKGYKGLGVKYPTASICFVIILISLTGLPVTAGFTGKVFMFSAVYSIYQQNHDIWLLALMITGALTTVVSLFYYIRIPLNLFIRHTDIKSDPVKSSYNLLWLAITICAVVLLLGIFPNFIYQYL